MVRRAPGNSSREFQVLKGLQKRILMDMQQSESFPTISLKNTRMS